MSEPTTSTTTPEEAPAPSPRLPKPEALLHMPTRRHALVEASAGTGKTYTLEHLVVDLILEKEARVGEILVVTFTEKAASELKRRVRARLRSLSGLEETATLLSPEQCWVIDESARRRLLTAVVEFDSARIETIHSFCHTVLRENPFPSGVLFSQDRVDGRRLHRRAFRDVLESRLLTDEALLPFLLAWLEEEGRSFDDLEALLFDASTACAVLGERFDEVAFRAAIASLPALPKDVPARVRKQIGLLRRALDAEQDGARLARLARVDLPRIRRQLPELDAALRSLEENAVSLGAVLVERIAARLEARRRELARNEGCFDYDDLISFVAQSLQTSPELAMGLRKRFRYVLIDEFQDTDRRQWQIFKRVFFDAPSSPVRLVGDPKQAIYGFRGADVQVYLRAREDVASRGDVVHLVDSYRATASLVDSLNLIFDPKAEKPFFHGPIRPERPLRCGDPDLRLIDADGGDVAPVVLLDRERGRDRRALAQWMAREIRERLTETSRALRLVRDGEASTLGPKDVFVLTRTHREAQEMATALRELGVPHSFYRQEGLFQSPEATHLLDLLAAIEDPTDRSKRLRAWLTPFFGLSLDELIRGEQAPPEHPLMRWLSDWNTLAEKQEYGALFDDLLDRTGIIRRALFLGDGERAAVNYRHVVDALLEELTGKNVTMTELRRMLSSYVHGRALPSAKDANVMKRENENAVSIMTIYAAKGLEAALVFVYAFSPGWSSPVQVYYENGERRMYIGRRSRAPEPTRLAIEKEEREEYQRLFYVALTRAKARVYLPLLRGSAGRGCYAQLNERLIDLADAFERAKVPPFDDSVSERGAEREDVASFRPKRAWKDGPDPSTFESLKRRHAGLELSSYSRLKARAGGYHPPEELMDGSSKRPESVTSPPSLPGGTTTGTLLHDILETVDLTSFRDSKSLEAWRSREDVASLVGRAMRRRGIEPVHRPEVERLVYLALTTPFTLGPHRLPSGLAGVERTLREVSFVYPNGNGVAAEPLAEKSRPSGYVEGSIDLLFEHRGRIYFCDWKSDVLPRWSEALVRDHIERNYRLQIKLYALAVTKMLGAMTEESYAARFGGVLYCFLRGLPKQAPHFERPRWDEIVAWREEFRA